MPEISESQLRKEIESDALAGLYVLYGEEKYLVALWQAAWRKRPQATRSVTSIFSSLVATPRPTRSGMLWKRCRL